MRELKVRILSSSYYIMLTSKELQKKVNELIAKEAAKRAAGKAKYADYVGEFESVITSVCFTEPNNKGDVFIRLSVANKCVPFFNQNGELNYGNTMLLFINQLVVALANSPELAIHADAAHLRQQANDNLPTATKILVGKTIKIAHIALYAGDKYVDPATYIEYDSVASRNIVQYSIVSIT